MDYTELLLEGKARGEIVLFSSPDKKRLLTEYI